MARHPRRATTLRVERAVVGGTVMPALIVPVRSVPWLSAVVALIVMAIGLLIVGAVGLRGRGSVAAICIAAGVGFLFLGCRTLLGLRRGLPRLALTTAGYDLTYAESMFDRTAEQLTCLLKAFCRQPALRTVPASLPGTGSSSG